MNKLKNMMLIVIILLTLSACKEEPVVIVEPLTFNVQQTENPVCEYNHAEYTTDEIEIISLSSDNSSIFGNVDAFINSCKTSNINPLVFAKIGRAHV